MVSPYGGTKRTDLHDLSSSGLYLDKAYDRIKKSVKCLLVQEVVKRRLLPARTQYKHEKPETIGQIWAEDFNYLKRASAVLVEQPVKQALEKNGGHGPDKFLLSDNGGSYGSDEHGKLLEKAGIVQKRIPACVPQYNGSVECGVKEFKNVFYKLWAKR